MQLEKGSAGFQPAAIGILPRASKRRELYQTVTAIRVVNRRQDADDSGQDARAPLPQLHGYGSETRDFDLHGERLARMPADDAGRFSSATSA